MSNYLWPHGLLPTRPFCSWSSPGKNTGMGSHFLLQGNLPDPGIKLGSPSLQADSLPSEPPRKPSFVKNTTFAQLLKAISWIHHWSLCFRSHIESINKSVFYTLKIHLKSDHYFSPHCNHRVQVILFPPQWPPCLNSCPPKSFLILQSDLYKWKSE